MRFPQRPPELARLVSKHRNLEALFERMAPTLADGRYLHWDDLRRRPPPKGMNHSDWWVAQKLARVGSRVPIQGFADESGGAFWFCRLDAIDRATHKLDRRDAVREMLESVGDDSLRAQYRIDQLIEEAISSSLIEGAKLTTRAQAQDMLREGRAPTSKGERMVANNYAGMQRLLELVDREIGLDDLLEIHAILGADALDEPRSEGRLRTAKDRVRIEDASTGEIWFVPPPAQQLEERLEAMLAFANDKVTGAFLHPLLRAITLHFWLAYLHPFVDGNGRMARALFYWQMLRSGYDFAQYLSISGPIDRSRRAYYRAFVLTETDGADLTYFLLHQLGVLEQATDELIAHLRDRARQLQQLPRSRAVQGLNPRQQSLLAALLRRPTSEATVTGHAHSHGVSYLTARKDLQDMEQAGLLQRHRVGKTDRYGMMEGLSRRLLHDRDRA
jgi:Fic family protein